MAPHEDESDCATLDAERKRGDALAHQLRIANAALDDAERDLKAAKARNVASDTARRRGIRSERQRIIECIEGVTGRRISDGGQYRADIESSLRAWKADIPQVGGA